MRAIPLACGDHSFPLLEHEQALALVAMLGVEGFDLALMGNRSHVRPEQVRGDLRGWAETLRARIERAGLRLADVFVIPWTDFETLAPNDPDPARRAEARALFADMLELAARLEAPGMTIVPGIDWPGESHADSLARAGEELGWRAEQAAARGLRFSIEPHIGSVCPTPEAVRELLALAPGLELTLDYTHFVAQGISHVRIDPLTRHARHVHARGGRPGRGQCGLRENAIDYRAIVERLLDEGYDGHLALEYVWIDWERMNECDNVSESVMLRDALRAFLAGAPWTYGGSTT
jgi:sugar phosphate isomerase/epimerase